MIEWHFGLSVFTERHADGFISLQPDYYGEADAGGPPLESVSPHGFTSTPRDPDVDAAGLPSKGAGLLYFHHGSEGFAYPTQDPRYHALLPAHGKGGATVAATLAAGAWRDVSTVVLSGDDGSVRVRAPYSAGARALLLELDTLADRIRATAGGGATYLDVDDAGVTLGNAIGALPVALATPLETWAASVTAALGQIAALLNAPGPVVGAPGAVVPAPPLPPTVAATKAKAV